MANPVNGQKPTPPSGYQMDVNPPAGYELEKDYSQVPAFLQQNLDMDKIQQVVTTPQNSQERNSTAEVSSDNPYKVKVLDPGLYGPPILNHELTHTFQETRNPNIVPAAPVLLQSRKSYDYGDIDGLEAAQKQGKTVSDFNYEQQAEMVKDYKARHDSYLKKAYQGKITPKEEREMYRLQQAYHPFIQQLASMPSNKENLNRSPLLELLGIQKPVPISGKSTTPGLPSYDTPGLGVLPSDPLMGGKSQNTSSKKKPTKTK